MLRKDRLVKSLVLNFSSGKAGKSFLNIFFKTTLVFNTEVPAKDANKQFLPFFNQILSKMFKFFLRSFTSCAFGLHWFFQALERDGFSSRDRILQKVPAKLHATSA